MTQLHISMKAKYIFAIIAIIAALSLYSCRDGKFTITQYDTIDLPAQIQPDYAGCVIPPNIAPLNFIIRQNGAGYFVRIHCENGNPASRTSQIEIYSKKPTITIPIRAWHELLDSNRGRRLDMDIYVKSPAGASSSEGKNSGWSRYQTVTARIAAEDIDTFLVYRRIRPGHSTWRDMGIYQRNLSSFDESTVLNNGYFRHGCVNCHTFCSNRTDKMIIGIRSTDYGSSAILVDGDTVRKIGTKFGYTSWHPSGKIAVFSVNKVRQLFHSAAGEVRDVLDFDSLMSYYVVESDLPDESGTVKTAPNLAKKDRLETYPAWSADGKYLYFCSAPLTWTDKTVVPESYDQIKYDLVRISYDIESDRWGELETVLSAEDTGLSILLPRISPDGRRLLFCMCDYGCFPVFRQSSDLYMMDLEQARTTGRYEYTRLDINSGQSESWHSWSSNSRWIVFSSKRDSGVFTRTYIAYVNEAGKVHKPIRLPQKDPAYYDSCLWTYSVPELVAEPVRATREKLGRVVRGSAEIPVKMPITMATPQAGRADGASEPWQTERE